MHKAYINAVKYPYVYYSKDDEQGVQQVKENKAFDKEAGMMPFWGMGKIISIVRRDKNELSRR